MDYRLSLTIPIFNESGNILPLVAAFKAHRNSESPCPYELILVDNGSKDNSAQELTEATRDCDWVKIITLTENVGYGGGVRQGLRSASPAATHLGWMPADLQYSIEDLHTIWTHARMEPMALHKGNRTVRRDGRQSQFVSSVYTQLARCILGLRLADVNGLPKVFPSFLFKKLNFPLATNFVLDSQILLSAQLLGVPIREHPVTFHARRAGVSSWSGKRLRVYRETLFTMFALRSQSKTWF